MRRKVGNQGRIVCCRKETFTATNTLPLKLGSNVELRPTFGDSNDVDKNLAVGDLPEKFSRIQLVVNEIFSGLLGSPDMPQAEEFECNAVANYVIAAKNSRNAPARRSVRNIHEYFFRTVSAIGPADLRIQPRRARADG